MNDEGDLESLKEMLSHPKKEQMDESHVRRDEIFTKEKWHVQAS